MDKKENLKNYVSPNVEILELVPEQGILQTSNYIPEEGNW